MYFRLHRPGPALSAFVEFLWYHEDTIPLCPKERILPTGAVDLLINLYSEPLRLFDGGGEQWFSGAFVSGPHSACFTIDPTRPQVILGVHFKPGTAFLFLGLPANELLNTSIPLDYLWGDDAYTLHERLLAAQILDKQFSVLEEALLKRLMQSRTQHPVVPFAVKAFQNVSRNQKITDVTDQIGLSQQRLGQIFRDEVGLTPKLYYRLQRFNQVLHLVKKAPAVDWTDLALTCGYYDQAHFIHDFQSFSGLNPTGYVARRRKEADELKDLTLTSPEIMYGSA
jgi:AraC-like DNA-binding protein